MQFQNNENHLFCMGLLLLLLFFTPVWKYDIEPWRIERPPKSIIYSILKIFREFYLWYSASGKKKKDFYIHTYKQV